MILSVSRRTDIPAFYGNWFMNRLHEGYCIIQNPVNNVYSELSFENLDGIVFWTKNAIPFVSHLKNITVPFYFNYTITPYGTDLEKNVPDKKLIIQNFIDLSKEYGKEKFVFRYDPIILNNKYTEDFHYNSFSYLARNLSPYALHCVVSFVDNFKHSIDSETQIRMMKEFAKIGKENNLKIKTCAEKLCFEDIEKSKCIDEKIFELQGLILNIKQDKAQRADCGCMESIDVGLYGTCNNQCSYCYAKQNKELNNYTHNENFPLMLEKSLFYAIKKRRTVSNKVNQDSMVQLSLM